MPGIRNAKLFTLNCYYNASKSVCLAIALGGGVKNSTCDVEGTDFTDVDKVF